ncbi:UNVERIFIED_CONTAM: L-rhamnose mutarotase [Microbacterium sp. SLM126]
MPPNDDRSVAPDQITEPQADRDSSAPVPIGLHSTLLPGAVASYRDHHARIPDDLREVFDDVGIREWAIWRSGDRLFHLVECDDFEAALEQLGSDPANDRWQADIGRFVDTFHGPDGEPTLAPMEHIWSFSRQREAS